MKGTWMRRALLAGTALAGLGPVPALAEAPKKAMSQAELEARLEMLESAVTELKAELATARQQAAQATEAAHAAQVAAATPPPPAPKPAPPSDGFTVAGTTVKIGGFIKTWASFSSYSGGSIANGAVGRDFYVPGQIPVGGARDGHSFEMDAKQTRFVLSTSTPIGGHVLKGLAEIDFQASFGAGTQRATNAYNPALRRAYFVFDRFEAGQDWSNFQYVAALPETTDYLGPSEGTIFVRQPQLRYTMPLSKKVALSVSVENPATTGSPAGTATVNEYGNDRMPDLTARLDFTTPIGEFSLAGLARELTVDTGVVHDNAFGWGVSGAGKIAFGPDKRHDLRFMITHGEGIGRYVGLNLAPDVIVQSAGGFQLRPVQLTAGFAALRLGWTSKLRSTFMGSFQTIDYPNGFKVATANDSVWSVAGNLFYSPVKQIDFGVEFRHGERQLVSGAKGKLDRGEFAARYNF